MATNSQDALAEMQKRLMAKLKPDPATGELDDGDILAFLREHENDPDLMALLGHTEATRKQKEASVDLDTFDFASLSSNPSIWRVILEPIGLVDPETQLIVDSNELAEYPNARYMFQLVGYVPSNDPDRLGLMDQRYIAQYTGLPKSTDLVTFLKKMFLFPFETYEPMIPTTLIISHQLATHESAVRPFLSKIPSISWQFEDAKEAEWMADRVYQRASADFKVHMAGGTRAKDRGNAALKAGQIQEAIHAYTEALRRFEDAHAQKVLEEEKKKAMEAIAVACANRSVARLKTGDAEEVELGRIDAENAIYADALYAKAYVRLARAYQAQKNLDKAQEAIARALRKPQLQNDAALVDILIELQSGGRGLPENAAEFKEWSQKVLGDKKMADVKGLWRQRIEERMAN